MSTIASAETGVSIEGRYRLNERLGEGSFGEVWRATDLKVRGRPVAVKLLKPEVLHNDEVVRRFHTEAEALGRINSPNVVRALDRGRWRGVHFIVTELVDGTSLARWIHDHELRRALPSIPDVRYLFEQILAGVASGHAVTDPGPIVHRDLKPENVMLERQPTGEVVAKVLDFGLARVGARSYTASVWVAGTIPYLAPEQAFGKSSSMGTWTDVFALGVILAEMLSTRTFAEGELPWWQLVLARPQDVRTVLSELRADLPGAMVDVLWRGLASLPEQRYRDAAELRDALRPAWTASAGGVDGHAGRSRAGWRTVTQPLLADVALGNTIAHRWTLDERLGEDDVGERWRVSDSLGGLPGELCFCTGVAADVESRSRFDRTLAALARARHEGVANVMGHGDWGARLYVVHEEAAGVRVSAWLDKYRAAGRPASVEKARHLFGQICGALAWAHRLRSPTAVTHGALEPGRIVVVRRADAVGMVKVLGMGLPGGPGRSSPYAPPEVVAGPYAPPSTDVFSLGVVLSELLTLRATAPDGRRWAEVTAAGELAVRDALDGLPGALPEVVSRALSYDPSHRFADAGELLAAVERAWSEAPRPRPPRGVAPSAPKAPQSPDPARAARTVLMSTKPMDAGDAPAHRPQPAAPSSPRWLYVAVAIMVAMAFVLFALAGIVVASR